MTCKLHGSRVQYLQDSDTKTNKNYKNCLLRGPCPAGGTLPSKGKFELSSDHFLRVRII